MFAECSTFSRKLEPGGSNGKRHSKKEAPARLEVPVALLLVLLAVSEAGEEGVSVWLLLSSSAKIFCTGTAVEIAVDETMQFARREGVEPNESSVLKLNVSRSDSNMLSRSSPSSLQLREYVKSNGRLTSFAGGIGGSDSSGGCGKEGSGLPGFSSHTKGIEATSLAGRVGSEIVEETPGFQSFLGIPGFSSQRNGTEGGCLTCFLFELSVNSFSAIFGISSVSSVALYIYMYLGCN